MALTPDPRLVAAIRSQPSYLQVPLLTTALIESGGRLDAVGDNGQSYGPYQEYTGGRGAGLSPSQREDPVGSTQRAAREFSQYYARGSRGALLAYQSQRPADQQGYMARYRSLLPQAQAILGQTGASPNSAAPAGAAAPAAPSSGLTLTPASLAAIRRYGAQSEQDVLQGRAPASAAPVAARLRTTGAPPAAQRQVAADALSQIGRAADPSAAQAVNAAESQLGRPYVWGAGGPSGPTTAIGHGTRPLTGFDCSSLVQYAWAQVGVKLPRTTYEQIKVGTAVPSLRAARPGDLLFPSTGHVQMYVGNGKVIEAPQTGGHVQVVPARSSYIAIRRPG